MKTLSVLGLGPGDPKYILPVAFEEIEAASVIAVNDRLLQTIRQAGIDTKNKCIIPVGAPFPLEESCELIRKKLKTNNVAVAVSGDTGFYSLLSYLKRKFPNVLIRVIPGISSIQYLFSKIGRTYHDTKLISLHGRLEDIDELLKSGQPLALLTDQKRGASYVAEKMLSIGIDCPICIGERLSYPDEKINWFSPEEAVEYQADPMTVLYIPGEKNE